MYKNTKESPGMNGRNKKLPKNGKDGINIGKQDSKREKKALYNPF